MAFQHHPESAADPGPDNGRDHRRDEGGQDPPAQRHEIPEPDAPDGDDDEDVVDELDRWD